MLVPQITDLDFAPGGIGFPGHNFAEHSVGVALSARHMTIDPSYGAAFRRARRAARDFREGAMALLPLSLVRRNQGGIAAGGMSQPQ